METEAVNTWGVCLSVKQLDGAGTETLPGPLKLAQHGGHDAGLLWAKSAPGEARTLTGNAAASAHHPPGTGPFLGRISPAPPTSWAGDWTRTVARPPSLPSRSQATRAA